MGKVLSKVFDKIPKDSPKRVLMLGLDNAGKTTILYRMKHVDDFQTVPTVGFNVETIHPCRGVSLTVWDVGGQDHIRTLWHHYFDKVDGLVFVIDATDQRRLSSAKAELLAIFQHESMKQVPLVIIANKQDKPGALKKDDILRKLDMSNWSHGPYEIQEASALKGDGLTDAFTALTKLIPKKTTKTSK